MNETLNQNIDCWLQTDAFMLALIKRINKIPSFLATIAAFVEQRATNAIADKLKSEPKLAKTFLSPLYSSPQNQVNQTQIRTSIPDGPAPRAETQMAGTTMIAQSSWPTSTEIINIYYHCVSKRTIIWRYRSSSQLIWAYATTITVLFQTKVIAVLSVVRKNLKLLSRWKIALKTAIVHHTDYLADTKTKYYWSILKFTARMMKSMIA